MCGELEKHIETYENDPDSWKAKKDGAKWASFSEAEALKMGDALATYKETLTLTLNMSST